MKPTIHSKAEFQRRARAKKAYAWALYIVRFSSLDVLPCTTSGWRATIKWTLGLTPRAWERLATHAGQHPPSPETVRVIAATLADIAMTQAIRL